jgi:hypothetical protein
MKKFLLFLIGVLLILLAIRIGNFFLTPNLPKNELDHYLQPDHPNVVKYAQTGVYEIFTLNLLDEQPSKEVSVLDQASCDAYGDSLCVNIITKNGKIIFETVSAFLAHPDTFSQSKEMIGSFYAFTPH